MCKQCMAAAESHVESRSVSVGVHSNFCAPLRTLTYIVWHLGCRSKALWRRRGKRKSSLSCMAHGMAHSWQPSRRAQSSFCGRRTRLTSIPPGNQGTWKPVVPLHASKLYTVWWTEVASR